MSKKGKWINKWWFYNYFCLLLYNFDIWATWKCKMLFIKANSPLKITDLVDRRTLFHYKMNRNKPNVSKNAIIGVCSLDWSLANKVDDSSSKVTSDHHPDLHLNQSIIKAHMLRPIIPALKVPLKISICTWKDSVTHGCLPVLSLTQRVRKNCNWNTSDNLTDGSLSLRKTEQTSEQDFLILYERVPVFFCVQKSGNMSGSNTLLHHFIHHHDLMNYCCHER